MGELCAAINYLAPSAAAAVRRCPPDMLAALEEVRLRVNCPLTIHYDGGRTSLLSTHGPCTDPATALTVTSQLITSTMRIVTSGSLYAVEEEIRQGFVTIPGGHRVGVCGQVTYEGQRVRAFVNFQSLCLRIARQVPGAGNPLLPYLVSGKRCRSTLIISPPQAGKTTMLRDVARLLSGKPHSFKVAIVDERSELAACRDGVPQLDVGPADVLDRCPKVTGIMMLIRSMSPQVIVTDELGSTRELTAVREAMNCGTAVVTSVHGDDVNDLLRRPSTREYVTGNLFDLFVVLSGTVRGQIAAVIDPRSEGREKQWRTAGN